MQSTNTVVVGAGPYGLSVSAYLTELGIEHRIFGTPMKTWLGMPRTMSLKSPDFSTNVCSPRSGFSMIEYCRARGLSTAEPLLIERFASYGLWAQEQLVPQLEQEQVTQLAQKGAGFKLELGSGERLEARQVVMAVGVTHFARMPPVLAGLPPEAASHTSHHVHYDDFRGKDVAVIGAGQSALEASVLLHEAGARPIQLVRGSGAHFHDKPAEKRSLSERIRNPMSVMGASRFSYMLEKAPFAVHYWPEARRVRLTRSYLGPVGSWWLAPRFEGNVPVLSRTEIAAAQLAGSRVALRLRSTSGGSGRELTVDHVLAGTGYEPDLDRLGFLEPALLQKLRRVERAPALNAQFESSVPNLYFIGLMSAFSFGPMFRFVAGAEFAAPRIATRLARAA